MHVYGTLQNEDKEFIVHSLEKADILEYLTKKIIKFLKTAIQSPL